MTYNPQGSSPATDPLPPYSQDRRESLSTPSITVCRRELRRAPEQRHILTEEIAGAGCPVVEVRDGPLDLAAADVVLMLGNAYRYPVARRQLEGAARSERPRLVVMYTEPLPPPRAAGLPRPRLHLREVAKILRRDPGTNDVYSNYFRLRGLARQGLPDLLLVTSLGRQEFLAERGIHAEWLPFGYHPLLGTDLGLPRDVEILFLGGPQPGRPRQLLDRLRRRGVDVVAMGGWSRSTYVGGEERTRLLNRTKILLNIPRYPGELPGLRLLLGMANKALVISEPMYRPAPYVPGRHFVSATIDEMPEAIGYYLTHDDERERIVTEAHRFVTQELPMARSVARLLELLGEGLARPTAEPPTG